MLFKDRKNKKLVSYLTKMRILVKEPKGKIDQIQITDAPSDSKRNEQNKTKINKQEPMIR